MPELQEAPVTEPAAFTAEEIEIGRAQARDLMANNAAVSGAAQAMAIARRAYGVAHICMQKAVKAANYNEAAEQAIAQSMAEFAGTPFNLGKLIEQVSGLLLPLLVAENADLQDAEQAAQRTVLQKAEDIRRQLPICTGFPWLEDKRYLPRGESLVLVGNKKALDLRLGDAIHAQGAERTVLHLSSRPTSATVTNTRDKPYLEVGMQLWHGAAQSQGKLDRFLAGWLRFARRNEIDLLVIDDLTMLVKPAFKGQPPLNTAPAGLGLLRKTCNKLGTGLICGIPRQELVVTEQDDEQRIWNELRQHAHVVPVNILSALGTQSETHLRVAVEGSDSVETYTKESLGVS